MEIVDKYDKFRNPLNITTPRDQKIANQYRLTAHVWIINSRGEFLIQKRNKPSNKNFELWSHTGGGVLSGETTLDAAIRECKEEIGLNINLENLEYMMSIKRKFNIIDVYLLYQDINIDSLVLDSNEVAEVKFVSWGEFQSLIHKKLIANNIIDYYPTMIKLIKKYKNIKLTCFKKFYRKPKFRFNNKKRKHF